MMKPGEGRDNLSQNGSVTASRSAGRCWKNSRYNEREKPPESHLQIQEDGRVVGQLKVVAT
jgi:hypothetical protein